MVKKESAKRGYMIPEEISASLKTRESPIAKINWINKYLKKGKLLSDRTKRSLYEIEADLYASSKDPELRSKAVTAYSMAGREDRAAQIMEQQAQLREECTLVNKWIPASFYYDAGFRYEKAGNIHKALECYKKSQDIDPKQYPKLNPHMAELKTRLSEGQLEKTAATASIMGIIAGIFFLSPNVTGNAIANLTNQTTSFLGAGLLIVGLFCGFFWMKSRKK